MRIQSVRNNVACLEKLADLSRLVIQRTQTVCFLLQSYLCQFQTVVVSEPKKRMLVLQSKDFCILANFKEIKNVVDCITLLALED